MNVGDMEDLKMECLLDPSDGRLLCTLVGLVGCLLGPTLGFVDNVGLIVCGEDDLRLDC